MKVFYKTIYKGFTKVADGIFKVGNVAYTVAHWGYVKANKSE